MKMRILIGAVLALSLGANAFLAGWLLSAASRPAVSQAGSERVGPLRTLLRELRSLPEAERETALTVVREYRPQLREQFRSLREARSEMRELLTSDDYSRAQAEAQFAKVREASTALQALAQTMTLDLADRLPVERRREIIEKMRAAR
jgi:Spy/CpxP family protein refolding chaperone